MRTVICMLLGFSVLVPAANDHPAQVAGIYEGTIAVKNADGRKIMLNLKQDGASEFHDGAKTLTGRWSASGPQLTVQSDSASAPMLWKIGTNILVLRDANKADYGKKGLVLRRPR